MPRPIYYDFETTGTDPIKDRVIEVAAFDPILNRTFERLVNPQCAIPPSATSIHNITDEMVKEAPTFAEVGQEFLDFCQGDIVLVAHNNDNFDYQFLLNEGKRHSLKILSWPTLDTLKWARKYRSDLPKHSLQYLRSIYGVPENKAHRALNDVITLHKVFTIMIDDLSFETVLALMASDDKKNSPLVMPFGKYRGQPLNTLPPHYIQWLKKEGALDKPENAQLKEALEKVSS